MKVADVSAFYTPHGGGVRTYVENKISYALKAGIDLVLIVPGATDTVEQRHDNARVVSVASPKLVFDGRYRYFRDIPTVRAILTREQPDIVEASSPWRTANIVADWHGNAVKALFMHADPIGVYADRWFGQFASQYRIDQSFAMYWRHLRRACAKFDVVVCANPELAQRLKINGISNTTIIPLGVDTGRFSPDLRSERLRQQLLRRCALPPTARLLIGVGRFSPEKRWPMVVEAVAAAGIDYPIGLILIGEGRGRPAVLRAIEGNPHICILQRIRDRYLMAQILASADALVHGCESETFGLGVAESAASGCPLIIPQQGGCSAFIEPSCTESYRPGDMRSLCHAIKRLFERDETELRQNAGTQAKRILSVDEHFDQLFQTYTSVTRRTSAA
jgi:alpha-1,6-mannosyltransferase